MGAGENIGHGQAVHLGMHSGGLRHLLSFLRALIRTAIDPLLLLLLLIFCVQVKKYCFWAAVKKLKGEVIWPVMYCG